MEKIQIREEYAPKLMIQNPSKEEDFMIQMNISPILLNENTFVEDTHTNFSKSNSLILEDNAILSKKLHFLQEQLLQLQHENSNLKELVIFSKMQIEKLVFDLEELNKSIPEQIRKSKNEYISALQCEMEISRNLFSRELQRVSGNSSLKGHGDPFFL
jgi:hypothetical protein